MTTSLSELKARVRAQKDAIPALYGKVDLDIVPERFTTDPEQESLLDELMKKRGRRVRRQILSNTERVEEMLGYTMMGDVASDAYASLMPTHGFRKLVDMLVLACERGIDAVKDAPLELVRLIESMERTPDWIDPRLSTEGARAARVQMAVVTPFVIRGAFLATFSNKYTGLPMALTGALSSAGSVQRVKETASFFTTATLPGALERFGPGFRAAAMVRLMHSMVRVNLLMHPDRWDVATYGVPIPQIDQMPAGTMPSLIHARLAARAKRPFNRRERAVVELCRHQCFLLGMPEDLLPERPEDILEKIGTYMATLRGGYDDETNGELVRTTMSAYLPTDKSVRSQVFNFVERSVSKVFMRHALRVPDGTAEQMGVQPGAVDYGIVAGFQAYMLPRLLGHMALERIPIAGEIADAWLVKRINELLVSYGHAEYTTDGSKYKAA